MYKKNMFSNLRQIIKTNIYFLDSTELTSLLYFKMKVQNRKVPTYLTKIFHNANSKFVFNNKSLQNSTHNKTCFTTNY